LTLTERLDDWAARAPGRTFLAKRDENREWRRISYAEFRSQARNIAQALLDFGLNVNRPLAVLSGNDIEHAVLEIAAMYAGIPYAPISPAYSLLSSDLGKLRYIFDLLTPGLIFASDGETFRRAIHAVVPRDTPIVLTRNPLHDRQAAPFSLLAATPAGPQVEQAQRTVNPETIAKILFTSGSTGLPKGVINTQRMLCSNQEMLRAVFPFFAETPPVICDWLPWHHTFGGNHNFGLVLYNGGTLYIDDGKPVAHAFEETIRNLREIAPTVYFNVPKGYEMLIEHLRREPALAKLFFSRLEMTFYAAAGLSQHLWDALDEIAIEMCGERILMMTGLGATETAPFAMCVNKETTRAGVVGLPVPGNELKLVPAGDKLEVRLRGPNVTRGFWRQDDLTRVAFDEEGYYKLGDAVRFIDPAQPAQGFVFDGRLAEDFKLSTGTWVSVGPLRARFILHCAPYVTDVVIAGRDRDEVTALIFPDPDHYRRLESKGTARATLERLLTSFAGVSTGSSNRIVRAIVLEEGPSIDAGEITDKGSINQHAVLERRATLVDRLYATPVPEDVFVPLDRTN
jgi:feruloyl-CoA synthase